MKNFMILFTVCVSLGICGCKDNKSASPSQTVTPQTEESKQTPDAQIDSIVDSDSDIVAVKELIKKSHLAVCNDDAEAFAECFVLDDTVKSLVENLFAVAKMQYQLEEALFDRFGEEGLEIFRVPHENPDKPDGVFIVSFMAPPKNETWWDDPDVEIEIEGSAGYYYNPWQNTQTPLTKQDGQWRFDFSTLPSEALPMAEKMQGNMMTGIQQCLELLKQDHTKVIDINLELGKAMFGEQE